MFMRKCEERKNEDIEILLDWQVVKRCQSQ